MYVCRKIHTGECFRTFRFRCHFAHGQATATAKPLVAYTHVASTNVHFSQEHEKKRWNGENSAVTMSTLSFRQHKLASITHCNMLVPRNSTAVSLFLDQSTGLYLKLFTIQILFYLDNSAVNYPIYLYLSRKHKTYYGNHMQRTEQWDHSGTEHCPKYIKTTKNSCLRVTRWKVDS